MATRRQQSPSRPRVECSLSRGARRHDALHIDEHFTHPAGMRPGAGLDIAMSPIKRDVLLHAHVGIKPNYRETERGSALVGEVKKRSAVTPSLFGWPHRDAVDEEVIATLFQHGNPDVLPPHAKSHTSPRSIRGP